MTKATHALHLHAKKDRNGNPQRLFVVMDAKGDVMDVMDEGYAGKRRLTDKWGEIPLHEIKLEQGEYRKTLRWWRDRNKDSGQSTRARAGERHARGYPLSGPKEEDEDGDYVEYRPRITLSHGGSHKKGGFTRLRMRVRPEAAASDLERESVKHIDERREEAGASSRRRPKPKGRPKKKPRKPKIEKKKRPPKKKAKKKAVKAKKPKAVAAKKRPKKKAPPRPGKKKRSQQSVLGAALRRDR